jgi:hypothetical protein
MFVSFLQFASMKNRLYVSSHPANGASGDRLKSYPSDEGGHPYQEKNVW